MKYHRNYRTVMDHRLQLGCRRLILTHMSDEMLQRLPLPDVDWAEDGKRIVL